MASELEYHSRVNRLITATVAAFAAVLLFCLPDAPAQVHGVPASVTSIGFGGHFDRIPGIPTSVTSLGPRGFNDSTHTFFVVQPQAAPIHHHHRLANSRGLGEVYAVPYYIPVPVVDPSADDSMEENNYPAGPTVFDRRASGESSQVAEATYAVRPAPPQRQPVAHQEIAQPAADAAPVPEGPATLLVFKDGHQLEVQNYAIVGSMLFDFTPGRRSKIALADLDLEASAKQNDDRGIDFKLPVTPGAN